MKSAMMMFVKIISVRFCKKDSQKVPSAEFATSAASLKLSSCLLSSVHKLLRGEYVRVQYSTLSGL